jgi:hypothetical protein
LTGAIDIVTVATICHRKNYGRHVFLKLLI